MKRLYKTATTKDKVTAASTRDISKNLVKVQSSNLWAYNIQLHNSDPTMGNVIIQFKGSHGGPGDIYVYYDVPLKLWRRFIGAPSKGHFFWKYIRDRFQCAKLTGDKQLKQKPKYV